MIRPLVVKMVKALDEKKAIHIQLLQMSEIVSYTDYILICTATSETHSHALMDNVERSVESEIKPIFRNSTKDKSWLILDYGDVILHIFNETARLYYNLESLWGDAPLVDLSKIL